MKEQGKKREKEPFQQLDLSESFLDVLMQPCVSLKCQG